MSKFYEEYRDVQNDIVVLKAYVAGVGTSDDHEFFQGELEKAKRRKMELIELARHIQSLKWN